ncbi:hypothetical protein V8E54_014861 [Elaphomyces granulatus]
MESIQWSNGRLRPRLGRQPRPAPKSTQSTRRIQGLTEIPRPHVTQTPRKRQRALTKSKLDRPTKAHKTKVQNTVSEPPTQNPPRPQRRSVWRSISRATRRDLLEPASDVDTLSEDSEASSGPEEPEELEECPSEASPEPEACPPSPSPNPEPSTPPLPRYNPPVSVEDRPGKPQNVPPRSTPLQLFQLFFTVEDIAILIEQTNPRARARGFRPLTVGEFYRYLGCLPQSIAGRQTVDPAIESPDIELPHVECLPDVERLDTERPDDIERPDVEWPDIEWPDAEWLDIDREWPDVERPDVERPDVEDVENIEPRLPEPPESAALGMERHLQERRGNRAYCVYCLKHKEDWRPHKHKIQHGQVSRVFGMDLTNTIANGRGKKDTRGYRIRGSRTPYVNGAAAGIFGTILRDIQFQMP